MCLRVEHRRRARPPAHAGVSQQRVLRLLSARAPRARRIPAPSSAPTERRRADRLRFVLEDPERGSRGARRAARSAGARPRPHLLPRSRFSRRARVISTPRVSPAPPRSPATRVPAPSRPIRGRGARGTGTARRRKRRPPARLGVRTAATRTPPRARRRRSAIADDAPARLERRTISAIDRPRSDVPAPLLPALVPPGHRPAHPGGPRATPGTPRSSSKRHSRAVDEQEAPHDASLIIIFDKKGKKEVTRGPPRREESLG